MTRGVTINQRVQERYGWEPAVVVTDQEGAGDYEERIATAQKSADENLVWIEWHEGLAGLSDDEIANGEVVQTLGGKYHPFDEGPEPCFGPAVLLPRSKADEHGFPCSNFSDVPDPVPAPETFDEIDFDDQSEEDVDADIPMTEEEIKEQQRKRERVAAAIDENIDADDEVRLYNLTHVIDENEAYFAFIIETTSESWRGKAIDEKDRVNVRVLYHESAAI